MPRTVVIGDANVDIIVPYPVFLNEERTRVHYSEPMIQGGGTAANTAVALSRLGMDTTLVGTIGNDTYGNFVREDLTGEGVDIDELVVNSALNTVGVFAFVDETGERYLWGWPRENQSFKYLDSDSGLLGRINDLGWVHSSGMAMTYPTSARTTTIELFRQAYEAGIPTSFDLNCRCDDRDLDPEFRDSLLEIISYTRYLLGSGPDEFAYLAPGEWKDNARSFASDSCTVIARDGCRGSLAFTANEVITAPGFSVEVVDTIGAGDVYNAGFINAMMNDDGLEASLNKANGVAAYVVARKGSRSSPTSEQLEEFLSTAKIR